MIPNQNAIADQAFVSLRVRAFPERLRNQRMANDPTINTAQATKPAATHGVEYTA